MVNTLSKHARIEAKDLTLWNELSFFGRETSSGYAHATRQQIADMRSTLTPADKRAVQKHRAEIQRVAAGAKKSETSDVVNALIARCENYSAKVSRIKCAPMLLVIVKQTKRAKK